MTRKACCLCEDAEAVLHALQHEGCYRLELYDVDAEPALAARYGMDVPVLLIEGNIVLKHRIDTAAVKQLLNNQ